MQVIPARANDRMIDGPVRPTASPMITKMPVPMTAPSPREVRSRRPTARLREPRPSDSSVLATRSSADLVANRVLGMLSGVLSRSRQFLTRVWLGGELLVGHGERPVAVRTRGRERGGLGQALARVGLVDPH